MRYTGWKGIYTRNSSGRLLRALRGGIRLALRGGFAKRSGRDKPMSKPYSYITDIERDYIYDRDEGVCQLCGCKVHKEVPTNYTRYDLDEALAKYDHIIRGNDNTTVNLRLVCRTCNLLRAIFEGQNLNQLLPSDKTAIDDIIDFFKKQD